MYEHANKVRLEVDASDVTNLIANHSAQGGATTGWSADTGVTLAAITNPTRGADTLAGSYTGGKTLRATYDGAASITSAVVSPSFSVLPGACIGAQISFADSRVISTTAPLKVTGQIRYYDGGAVLIGTAPIFLSTLLVDDTPWRMHTIDRRDAAFINGVYAPSWSAQVTPHGAATARIALTFQDASPTPVKITRAVYLAKLMVIEAAAYGEASNVPFSDATVWQDVAGSAKSMKIVRGGDVEGVVDDIEAGTLTAVVEDSIVDPAQNERMRVGRLCRVTSLDSTGVWRPLFTGRISSLDVDYVDKSDPSARPKVSLVAADAVEELRRAKQPFNYAGAYGPKVKALMASSSVPYTADAGTASTDINHRDRDEGRLWDQLVLARNSFSGGALWVDQAGTLKAVTVTPTGTPEYTFTDRPNLTMTNVAPNPSFESTGTMPTTVLTGSISQSRTTTWAADGTYSYTVQAATVPCRFQLCYSSAAPGANGVAVVLGDRVAFRMAVRAFAGVDLQVTPKMRMSGGTVKSFDPVVVLAGTTEIVSAVDVVDEPGATYAHMFVEVCAADGSDFASTGFKLYADAWALYNLGANGWPYEVPYFATSGVFNATPYTDVDVKFGSGVLVNDLSVILNNDGEPDGSKEYGPYRNVPSQVDWGVRSATLEAIDGTPSTLAAAYLDRYASPVVFPRGLTFRWSDVVADDQFVDLYDEVRAQHFPSGTDAVVPVLRIEHTITPRRWDITLGLRPQFGAAGSVTVTNPAGGANTGPDDVYGGVFDDEAACSTALTCGTSAADVTGATLTVNVTDSSKVYYVYGTFDIQTLTTGGGTFIGRLVVDGVTHGEQVIWAAPATTGARETLSRRWRITGLASGNRVFKLQASGTVASVYRVNTGHSTVAVQQKA